MNVNALPPAFGAYTRAGPGHLVAERRLHASEASVLRAAAQGERVIEGEFLSAGRSAPDSGADGFTRLRLERVFQGDNNRGRSVTQAREAITSYVTNSAKPSQRATAPAGAGLDVYA